MNAPPPEAALADPWPAPYAEHPVDAVVDLPGSKSLTNRALVLAALAAGTSAVRRPLRSRDTELMAGGLRALGVAVADVGADWVVTGSPGPLRPAGDRVHVGNAGTVARFLPPVAALATGTVTFDGDPRMRDRPVAPLLGALRSLGASVDGDRLPLAVHGTGRLRGGAVALDASRSSQLVSGLLLVGARCDEGLVVRHVGPPLPSRPHVAMTVALLRGFGAAVAEDGDAWRVAPGGYAACDVDVEPDLSNAAPFLAAAAATGGRVRVPGWPAATTQPGAALPELLGRMGARFGFDAGGLTLTGPDRLDGLDADLSACGELAPVLAALAALARTPSRIVGIAHLRGHETDRLAALATELGRLGAAVEELPDGLVVTPRPLSPSVFRTYDDHRLAQAAAVVGLAVRGVEVADVATTAKTMPDFPARWTALVG